ncbi:thyrotropin-releasing hormone receptor-like isoform X2 [Octopus sinensis]|nr:thyrotropin-releasing hormone receptor-like isoform X2 [Octopus sinensis]
MRFVNSSNNLSVPHRNDYPARTTHYPSSPESHWNNDNSSSSNITSLDFYWEHRFAVIINLYMPPILIVLGSICNCLVVKVMVGRWFSSVSTSVYLIAGTIADTASLLIVLPAHWFYVNFPASIHRSEDSHFMCKFFNFFGWGGSDYAIILTVAMTVDKAIAILFPMKAQTLCTTKRAKRVIFMLVWIIILKESHFLFTSNIVPLGRTEQLCTVDIPNETYRIFYEKLWPTIHNFFLFLSFTIIIISNIIIISKIKKSRDFKKFSDSMRISQSADRTKGPQITIMLLIESFTLVILTLPFSLYVTVLNTELKQHDLHMKSIHQLVFAIVFYLLYVNRCLNFCMYCLTGSRFRGAFLEAIGCRKLAKKHSTRIKLTATPASSCEPIVSVVSKSSL